jgi:hypothetical protein
MRTALIPFVNQYVLAKGWITDWKDDEERDTRRVSVSNVIIKKADKCLTFDNQTLISKEDHLNFFVPLKYISTTFHKKYACLALAGYITAYTRKDGSIDYGIELIKQSLIEECIRAVCIRASLINPKKYLTPESLLTLHILKQEIIECDKKLEEAGEYLPTFYSSYAEYKQEIKEWIKVLDKGIATINSVCSNRAMRRANKIKTNFARTINQYYGLPV